MKDFANAFQGKTSFWSSVWNFQEIKGDGNSCTVIKTKVSEEIKKAKEKVMEKSVNTETEDWAAHMAKTLKLVGAMNAAIPPITTDSEFYVSLVGEYATGYEFKIYVSNPIDGEVSIRAELSEQELRSGLQELYLFLRDNYLS